MEFNFYLIVCCLLKIDFSLGKLKFNTKTNTNMKYKFCICGSFICSVIMAFFAIFSCYAFYPNIILSLSGGDDVCTCINGINGTSIFLIESKRFGNITAKNIATPVDISVSGECTKNGPIKCQTTTIRGEKNYQYIYLVSHMNFMLFRTLGIMLLIIWFIPMICSCCCFSHSIHASYSERNKKLKLRQNQELETIESV